MKEIPNKKELSPIIASIILIAVTVTVAIAVAAWMSSLTIGVPTKIEIHSQIYSADHNIGVLNENAIFDISIENAVKETREFNILVSAEENEVYNETVELIGLEKRNIIINQKLLFTGLWTIKIFEENKIVDGYSFVTMTNDVEAELEITEIDKINFNNNLLTISLIVLVFTLILGIVSFWFVKVRGKKVEKNNIEKRN